MSNRALSAEACRLARSVGPPELDVVRLLLKLARFQGGAPVRRDLRGASSQSLGVLLSIDLIRRTRDGKFQMNVRRKGDGLGWRN